MPTSRGGTDAVGDDWVEPLFVTVPRRVSALGLTEGRGGMGGRATAAPPGEAVDDEDKVESWGRAAVVDKDDEMLVEEDVDGGELGAESPSIDGV